MGLLKQPQLPPLRSTAAIHVPRFDVAVHSLTSGSECFVQKSFDAVVTVLLRLCYGFLVVNRAVTSPEKML